MVKRKQKIHDTLLMTQLSVKSKGESLSTQSLKNTVFHNQLQKITPGANMLSVTHHLFPRVNLINTVMLPLLDIKHTLYLAERGFLLSKQQV